VPQSTKRHGKTWHLRIYLSMDAYFSIMMLHMHTCFLLYSVL
jgi:hypothetical protein